MKYKDWIICDLEVDDSLVLSGRAEREGESFLFSANLAKMAVQTGFVGVRSVSGVEYRIAFGIASCFVGDVLYGAARSAVESARDRLNDFIADELEDGKE